MGIAFVIVSTGLGAFIGALAGSGLIGAIVGLGGGAYLLTTDTGKSLVESLKAAMERR